MAKQQKKLKVAMVGGGNESFSGKIHRAAIEASGCLELVCGAFGSTRQRSIETGKSLGLPKRQRGGQPHAPEHCLFCPHELCLQDPL